MTPIRALYLAALLVIGNADSAQAIAIGFDPTSSSVGVGALFDVDVVVSGLPLVPQQVVSAYDLDIAFDDSVISAFGVTFGTSLGAPLIPFLADFTILPGGVVNVLQASLLFDKELKALQSDTVTLFTIQFQALAVGTSPLTFVRGTDDIKSVEDPQTPFIPLILQIEASTGSVDVTERAPEPGTTALILLGLFQLVRRRRERS